MPVLACRGCLATGPRLFNLFKNNLYEEFGEVVGIPIFEGDDQPQHICGMCYAQLLKFVSFRDRCRRVQDMLEALELQAIKVTTTFIETIDRGSHNLLLRLEKVVPSQEDLHIDEDITFEFIADDADNGEQVDLYLTPQSTVNEQQPEESQSVSHKKHPPNNNAVVQPVQPNSPVVKLIRPNSNTVKLWPLNSKVVQKIQPKNKSQSVIRKKNLPAINAVVQPIQPNSNKIVKLWPINNKAVKRIQPKNNAVVPPKQPMTNELRQNKLHRQKLSKVLFEDPKYCEFVEREFNVKIITLTKDEQIKEIHDKISEKCISSNLLCLECGKIFNNAQLQEKHIKQCHDASVGPYVCDVCNYRFPEMPILHRHKRNHKFRVICTKCNFKTPHLSVMIQHSHWHSGVMLKCTHCDKIFEKKEVLNAHLKSEHKNHMQWCKCCGQTFLRPLALNGHIKRYHSFLLKPDHNCPKCGLTFCSAEALSTHTSATCGDFACVMCGKRLENEDILRQHVIRDHSRWEIIKMVRCPQCLLEFYGEVSLAKHNETCGSGYPCQECGLNFPDTESLQYHKETHLKSYRTCEECNLTFDSDNYRRHCESLHHTKPARVQRCRQKTTARMWSVSGSIITSNVVTPVAPGPKAACKYICDVCGKGCTTLTAFKAHAFTHSDDKPFKCELCSRAFNRKRYYQHHMMLHKGIKLFKCSQCDKQFHSRSGRSRHLMRHAGIRRHVCNICKKAYVTSTEVKTHIKHVHLLQPKAPRKRRTQKNKDNVETDCITYDQQSNHVRDDELEYIIEETVMED